MKAFWDNYFFDIENSNLSKEEAVLRIGKEIASDLIAAENLINNLEPKEAIEVLRNVRKYI